MIAQKSSYIDQTTTKKQGNHDCTKSSFIDKKNAKTHVMIAQQIIHRQQKEQGRD